MAYGCELCYTMLYARSGLPEVAARVTDAEPHLRHSVMTAARSFDLSEDRAARWSVTVWDRRENCDGASPEDRIARELANERNYEKVVNERWLPDVPAKVQYLVWSEYENAKSDQLLRRQQNCV